MAKLPKAAQGTFDELLAGVEPGLAAIARRLRAMLENLIQTLPESHGALLRQELNLLHRSAERCFAEPEDRALAGMSDLQGVGGTVGQAFGPDTPPKSQAGKPDLHEEPSRPATR